MASPGSLASERALGGRVPDFFIVGHAKCGTTALYEMLRRHPQIFMPDFKEPMFFARNPNVPASATAPRSFEQTGRRTETLADYMALFAPAQPGQLTGEASTFYLSTEDAPARIAKAQPGARIIAILREPAAFLASLHMQMLQNQAESERDLLKAIALEDNRRQGRDIPRHAYWPRALMYSDRVRYVDQLQRYHAHFPREQVLALIYDDFRADNAATVKRVLSFLGVDADAPLQTLEANPSVNVRAVRLDSLVRDVREGRSAPARAARGAVRALTSTRLRSSVLYPLRRKLVYGESQPPDERVVAELRRRFAPEVAALSEYLERDLVTLWGYQG
jgi:Sulfotransferase domain